MKDLSRTRYTLKECINEGLTGLLIALIALVVVFIIVFATAPAPVANASYQLLDDRGICTDIQKRNVGVVGPTKAELQAHCNAYGIRIK